MSDKKEVMFKMSAMKKDGTQRTKESKYLNDCIKALWRTRDVVEGHVTALCDGITYRLLAKIGRRRGVNTDRTHTGAIEGRPMLTKAGSEWQRLPSRFNDLK